jgi:hypothetical protein
VDVRLEAGRAERGGEHAGQVNADHSKRLLSHLERKSDEKLEGCVDGDVADGAVNEGVSKVSPDLERDGSNWFRQLIVLSICHFFQLAISSAIFTNH